MTTKTKIECLIPVMAVILGLAVTPLVNKLYETPLKMTINNHVDSVIERKEYNPCGLKDVYCEGEVKEEVEKPKTDTEVIIKRIFGKDWRMAQAIMLAESNGRNISSPYNTNRTRDHGIFQVNDIHGHDVAVLLDEEENIKIAKKIYDDRASWDNNGWNAWSTYHNKSYKKFL